MSKWGIPVQFLVNKIKDKTRVEQHRLTFNLFQNIMRATPVDTGRLRANWNVSYGSPDFSRDYSNFDISRNDTQLAKIDKFKLGKVWLTNSIDYARIIENGRASPIKAPNGMLRINVLDTVNQLKL